MSNNGNGWDPVKFDQWLTTPPDEDEDLEQPPEPGMTWNPAREEWSHEPLTHDEWESLTPSEQAFYEEPLQDTFEVDLKDLARLQPDFAAGLRDEISKVFQVPAQLLQPRNDNQSVSEGGGSKQN